MKRLFLLFVFLVVLVSGCTEPAYEDLVSCSTDEDCVCGLIIATEQCYVGNRAYIEPSGRCFKLCFGSENREAKCINNECEWVKIKQGEPEFPVADIIYGEVQEEDNLTEVTVKNTGPVAFLPILNLNITRDNVSVYNIQVEYNTLEPGKSEARQIPIPVREEPGEWVYNMSLTDSEGRLICYSSIVRERVPEPVVDGYMYYTLKTEYLILKNITIGVTNSGDLEFTPMVQITIQRGDVGAFIDTQIYSKLKPGKNATKNFILPTLDNTTYYFEFILKDRGSFEELERSKFEIKIGP